MFDVVGISDCHLTVIVADRLLLKPLTHRRPMKAPIPSELDAGERIATVPLAHSLVNPSAPDFESSDQLIRCEDVRRVENHRDFRALDYVAGFHK